MGVPRSSGKNTTRVPFGREESEIAPPSCSFNRAPKGSVSIEPQSSQRGCGPQPKNARRVKKCREWCQNNKKKHLCFAEPAESLNYEWRKNPSAFVTQETSYVPVSIPSAISQNAIPRHTLSTTTRVGRHRLRLGGPGPFGPGGPGGTIAFGPVFSYKSREIASPSPKEMGHPIRNPRCRVRWGDYLDSPDVVICEGVRQHIPCI